MTTLLSNPWFCIVALIWILGAVVSIIRPKTDAISAAFIASVFIGILYLLKHN